MRGWIRRVFILLSAFLVALVSVVYIFLIAPRRLIVEEVPVVLSGWPADAEPARVVVLGDLHAGAEDGKWLERIVEKTLSLQPEVVILLGDYFNALNSNNAMSPEEVAEHLAPLSEHCTVYFVCGNHDYGRQGMLLRQCMRARNMQLIENHNVVHVFSNGQRLMLRGASCMAGVATGAKKGIPTYMERRFSHEKLPHDMPLMLVTHHPLPIYKQALWADIAVAGHTHGGQVCSPGGNPVTEEDSMLPDEMRGGLKTGKTGMPLYVTRGLGLSRMPLRLFCPPEITLLLLSGNGNALPHR